MSLWSRIVDSLAEKAPVIKTKNNMSMTAGPVILQGKSWDEGTRVHEQTHVKQFLRDPLTTNLRYMLDDKYRWRMEKEAVKAQIEYYAKNKFGVDWESMRNMLFTKYKKMATLPEIDLFLVTMKSYYSTIASQF